jgi:hypothetical protein
VKQTALLPANTMASEHDGVSHLHRRLGPLPDRDRRRQSLCRPSTALQGQRGISVACRIRVPSYRPSVGGGTPPWAAAAGYSQPSRSHWSHPLRVTVAPQKAPAIRAHGLEIGDSHFSMSRHLSSTVWP